jgi:hypothetical protein
MTGKPDLDGYNTVPERIAEFRAKYPDGRLRPVDETHPYRVHEIGQHTFIVYAAAAYRDPLDPCPGIGLAWEPFPGRTPYTRDSELMNAETSAWGRAIVAALAADTKKGVASQEEVRNRSEEQPERKPRTGTNAALRAEGRMDRQQKAAHEQLEADTKREPKRAERSRPRTPEPSPWDTDAPVTHERAAQLREDLNGNDLTEPEDKPGSILSGQRGALERLLSMFLGKQATRSEVHEYLSDLLGIPVESVNDLSMSLAGEAIRKIQADIDQEKAARV